MYEKVTDSEPEVEEEEADDTEEIEEQGQQQQQQQKWSNKRKIKIFDYLNIKDAKENKK